MERGKACSRCFCARRRRCRWLAPTTTTTSTTWPSSAVPDDNDDDDDDDNGSRQLEFVGNLAIHEALHADNHSLRHL